MSVTVRMIFRGLEPSDALADYVRFRAVELLHEHAHVEQLDVVIDAATECGIGGGRFRASVKTTGAASDGLARTAAFDHPCAAIDAAFGETCDLLEQQKAILRAHRARTTTRLPSARKAG